MKLFTLCCRAIVGYTTCFQWSDRMASTSRCQTVFVNTEEAVDLSEIDNRQSSDVTDKDCTDESTDHDQAADPDWEDCDPLPRGRKRSRNVANWKKNIRKHKRATGVEYVGVGNKRVSGKTLPAESCQCAKHCYEKISQERRKQIFDSFYNLDFNGKRAFVGGVVKQKSVARKYTQNEESRKNTTRVFSFLDTNSTDVVVCKKFFLSTLQVSNGFLDRVMQKVKVTGTPQPDQRGKHIPGNKTKEVDVTYVKNFIRRFPVYESHYSRKDNPDRKYFAPGLNARILYDLYKQTCTEEGRVPLQIWMFRQFLNYHFNIAFHSPLSDTCKTCDTFTNKETLLASQDNERELNEVKAMKDLHLRKAQAARDDSNRNKEAAKDDPNLTFFTFDLMKTLPTPVVPTGIVYYKRQLWTFNLGIHDARTENGYMYIWNESMGSRGPREIASCLLKHMTSQPMTPNLVVYSDCCGGQNRNIRLATFWLHVVCNPAIPVTRIDHKFYLPGHSYMDSDRDFGVIEKAKKTTPSIMIPDEWTYLIKNAKQRNKFVVTSLTSADIIDTKAFEDVITNRKHDTQKEKVNWLKIQWMRFQSTDPFKIFFKYSNQEIIEFRCIDLKKRRSSGRPSASNPESLGEIVPPVLYPEGRAIQEAKYKDLQDLLPLIPPVHHGFYHNLKHGAAAVDGDAVEEQ